MSNEKKNSILKFIEENYPDEIETDYDKGWAYASDEIKKLLDEDDAEDKIWEFIKNNTTDLTCSDFSDSCAYICEDIAEILDQEEGSIMIKHMKAPKECGECLFCTKECTDDYGSYGYCLLLDQKGINLLTHDKPSDCPIVEVEHPNN